MFSFQTTTQVVMGIYQSQIPLCLQESVFAVGGKSPVIANTTKEFQADYNACLLLPQSLFLVLLCTCLSDTTHQDKIDTEKVIRSTIDKFLSMGITLNTFAVKNGFAHNP